MTFSYIRLVYKCYSSYVDFYLCYWWIVNKHIVLAVFVARNRFSGINHWKQKHPPRLTQICQQPTAARKWTRKSWRVIERHVERCLWMCPCKLVRTQKSGNAHTDLQPNGGHASHSTYTVCASELGCVAAYVRSVLPWMIRHCRGARVPPTHRNILRSCVLVFSANMHATYNPPLYVHMPTSNSIWPACPSSNSFPIWVFTFVYDSLLPFWHHFLIAPR